MSNEATIILPTLNEAESIGSVIESIFAVKPKDHHYTIIVVDDGSIDGTLEQVSMLQEKYPIELIQRLHATGLSSAILVGVEKSTTDWVLIMDADGSHPPEMVPELLKSAFTSENEIIIGSRYCSNGRITGWPLKRLFLSKVGTFFASVLTHVSDPLSGFFVARRNNILENCQHARGYKILLELLNSYNNLCKVEEVPIHFSERQHGSSKLSLRVQLQYIFQLTRLFSSRLFNAMNIIILGLLLFILIIDGLVSGYLLSIRLLPYNLAQLMGFFMVIISLLFVINQSRKIQDNLRQTLGSGWFIPLIFIFVYALRVGVIDLALRFTPTSMQTVIWSGSVSTFAGLFFFFIMSRLFPFQWFQSKGETLRSMQILVFLGVVFFLKLLYLPLYDLIAQEALHWNRAMHLAPAYVDHPGGVAFIIKIGTIMFGNTAFGVRFGAFVCGIIASIFIYGIGYRLTGNKLTGLYSVLAFNLCPFFWGAGFFVFPDSPLLAAWSGAVYFFLKAIDSGYSRLWFLAGLCAGFALFSKYTTVVLLFSMGLFALVTHSGRRILFSRAPLIFLGGTLIACFPLLIFEHSRGWLTFKYQFLRRMSHKMWGFPSFIGSMMGELSPIFLLLVLVIIITMLRKWNKYNDQEKWLLIAGVPLLIMFSIYSQWNRVKYSWPAPAFISLIPLVIAFNQRNPKSFKKLQHYSYMSLLFFFLFQILIQTTFFSVSFTGPLMYPVNETIAWRGLTDELAKIETQVEEITGKKPFVIGLDKYFLAAEATFYHSQQLLNMVTSRNAIGRDGLTWNEWSDLTRFKGKPAILLSWNRKSLKDPALQTYFSHLSLERELNIKSGLQQQTLFMRIGFDYKGLDGSKETN